MKNNIQCKECGENTIFQIEGSTEGFYCEKCNWALVTTSIPMIAQDITRYKIFLLSSDYTNSSHLKVISSITGLNLIQARNITKLSNKYFFEGEALEIMKKKEALDKVQIKYIIQPDYPY